MTKVKFNLDDELAILLQAYQDQSGTDRDAIINQAVKHLLVKKLGKKRIAQLLKDSEDGSDIKGNTVGYYDSPRYRATVNADWSYRNFVSSVFINYSGKTRWAYGPWDKDNTPENCTASNANPSGTTRRSSMLAGVPSQCTRQPRARSSRARARPSPVPLRLVE